MTKANGAKRVLFTKIRTNMTGKSMGVFAEKRLQNYGNLSKVSEQTWLELLESFEHVIYWIKQHDDDLVGYANQFINQVRIESNGGPVKSHL